MSVRAFAQSIVETVRHPLVVLSDDLRVWKANLPFYRTFGGFEADTEGQFLFDLAGGVWNFPHLRTLLDEVVRGNSFQDFEIAQEFPIAGRKNLLLDAHRVHHDDGTPQILLSIEDITEPVRVRDELRRLNVELEQRVRERTAELESSNRELEAFCYSVSHDLRAPLRVLNGFSEELIRSYPGKPLDEKGKHYLLRIQAGTQRMGQLIDCLLGLSKISRCEMKQRRVNLSDMANGILAELRQHEPEREVAVKVEPNLTAWGDPGLLRVVLDNLLRNAWKFTAKRPGATIGFGFTPSAEPPAFFVRDNGAGFDMTHATKLFGAFQRLHSEREFPGHGIGLATVQRAVRRHGGQIWAEGAPDKGATFFFSLPEGASA